MGRTYPAEEYIEDIFYVVQLIVKEDGEAYFIDWIFLKIKSISFYFNKKIKIFFCFYKKFLPIT